MSDAQVIARLRDGFNEPVRDTLWGHVYLTAGLEAITRSAPFTRLHRIMQLGPCYLVYPGATHTRAAHSVGVACLARRLLLILAERGAAAWLSPEGVSSFLCAALLHDLGHFPYTHSLKDLPLERHEVLTARAIRREPTRSLVGRAGGDPDFAAAIVEGAVTAPGPADAGPAAPGGAGGELRFYQRVLSGVLDPDKLDYLNRDARYCGVPYGVQDVDFVLGRLYPHPDRGVDTDSRGLPGVEALLFAKYLMYRTVYWHHRMRAATAMIKRALLRCLERGAVAGEDLYGLDDQGIFGLLDARGSESERALAARVREGRFHATAGEFPHDAFFAGERRGRDGIHARTALEADIAGALSRACGVDAPPGAVIVDVPERLSLESDLFVRDEDRAFSWSTSVFAGGAVDRLAGALRVTRVFVDPALVERAGAAGVARALEHLL